MKENNDVMEKLGSCATNEEIAQAFHGQELMNKLLGRYWYAMGQPPHVGLLRFQVLKELYLAPQPEGSSGIK